jgi:hypothetical protein
MSDPMGQTTDWEFQTITNDDWTAREDALRAEGWDLVNINETANRVILKRLPATAPG